MRTRIADLIRDAIDIITACDDPDCEAWLNQAKAELAVMNAKAELRSALAAVEGPVQPKVKLAKPKVTPKLKSTKAGKIPNGKLPASAVVTAS